MDHGWRGPGRRRDEDMSLFLFCAWVLRELHSVLTVSTVPWTDFRRVSNTERRPGDHGFDWVIWVIGRLSRRGPCWPLLPGRVYLLALLAGAILVVTEPPRAGLGSLGFCVKPLVPDTFGDALNW